MKFKGEAPGLCCSGGKVHLPVLRDPPEPLHTLLSSDSGQKPHNRHDLLARVFHGKLKILMNLSNKGKIFGVVQCYMYTIEWQKRILPHARILVWLQETLHVHKVDDFISAEIPNSEEDLELFNCITTQMVHGPCGVIKPFLHA
ncbi:helitron_like_N domain-containing protein [Trichonephila clavata]|uniref:Helitron_like_N domain-containing protein n=1 Tax=Trichonephila clavata TaxID=2740835 RepID=A0A8X6JTY5_TRICU|nr:helitron_like_N domain-containing protein [Trichonephila clavata]